VIGLLSRRLLGAALTVVAVSFVAFVAFGLSLDPTNSMVMGDPTPHGAAARMFVKQHYHLDDPILSQYVRWAGGVVRHGFGNTISTDVAAGVPFRLRTNGQPIGPQLWHAAGITAAIVGAALVLVVAGSALVGTVSARRRPAGLSVSTRMLAYLGAAVPVFLIGDLLRHAVTGQAHVTAALGPQTGGGGWFLLGPPAGGPVGWVRHLALPVFVLALGLTGIYARYVRSSMLVELDQPYVTVARAKGLSERRVVVRHALRAGLAPFVALLSIEMGAVIGASIAVDGVFGSGGLATEFLSALGRADPYELTSILVVSALIVCGFAFLGDWLVIRLDPRVAREPSARG